MMKELHEIVEVIRHHDDFLITSHENPDGDAIGSMAAVGHLLKTMGKRFSIFNESLVPEKYHWVNMPGQVLNTYQPGRYSWTIVLDCGDLQRTGKQLSDRIAEPVINIDHHTGNPGFGQINWVDTAFSSVGEMVAGLADLMQVKLNGPMAEGIYLAVVSDTGFFSFGNTSPEVLELSARLIRSGINPGLINSKILNQWTPERLRLHGMAMQQALFCLNDRAGIVSVTKEMLDKTGASADDCEGLVNTVQNVRSVEVAISLREEKPGRIKFSLRSTGDINVQLMAAELKGGGHKNASGGVIHDHMDRARDRIMEVVARHITG